MTPINAPIFTARQLTPKTIFSKPTDNYTNKPGYFSGDSIEDPLTIWVLLYTKLTCFTHHFVPYEERLRTRTLLMNIQYLMFFYFVLSLTFIKVKPQASLKSLRTMKELLCYSFRLDVELIF